MEGQTVKNCKFCQNVLEAFKNLISDKKASDREILDFTRSLVPESEQEISIIEDLLDRRPVIKEQAMAFLISKYRKQKKASCLV
ncbi:hypothetical protein C4572_02610 [Candidatus Parcubacteria bacterium]|nr:MAG: hypothetical protein C4572_02610 [Candidatus Parcubacteria bacterium]